MVARRAEGYKMNVVYTKRTKDEKSVDLDTLFAESDVVTLHVPLNGETGHLMNKSTFEKLKKGYKELTQSQVFGGCWPMDLWLGMSTPRKVFN